MIEKRTQKTYVYGTLIICGMFKYELIKSYESCPPEEWKNMRDKRFTNDEWDILIEYWT